MVSEKELAAAAAAARSGADKGCLVTVSSDAEGSVAVLGAAEGCRELWAGASWLAATETIRGPQAELSDSCCRSTSVTMPV